MRACAHGRGLGRHEGFRLCRHARPRPLSGPWRARRGRGQSHHLVSHTNVKVGLLPGAARGSAGREDRAAGSCLLRDLLARPAAPSRGTFAVWTPAPHCFVLHGRRHPSQPAAGSDSAVGNGPPAVSAPHRGGSRGAGPCGGLPRRRGRTHSYKCPGHFTSASKVAVCPRVPTSPAWRKLGA